LHVWQRTRQTYTLSTTVLENLSDDFVKQEIVGALSIIEPPVLILAGFMEYELMSLLYPTFIVKLLAYIL
jgi:hypothetical protein